MQRCGIKQPYRFLCFVLDFPLFNLHGMKSSRCLKQIFCIYFRCSSLRSQHFSYINNHLKFELVPVSYTVTESGRTLPDNTSVIAITELNIVCECAPAQQNDNYSYINIATYIEITTIMECQISRVILSYNSTNFLSCPLNIVIDHIGHMTIRSHDLSSHL